MEIAADGRFQRVEIGMSVKPEHKEQPVARRAIPGIVPAEIVWSPPLKIAKLLWLCS